MSGMSWKDQVQIQRRHAKSFQMDAIWVDEFLECIYNDPSGNRQVIIDQTYDFSILASPTPAAYYPLFAIPAYSFIEYMGLIIGEQVIGTGNFTLLGLGQHSGTPNTYGGNTLDLLPGTSIQVAWPGSTDNIGYIIDICGVSSGITLTTGTITSGIFRVVCQYRTPNILSYPAPTPNSPD